MTDRATRPLAVRRRHLLGVGVAAIALLSGCANSGQVSNLSFSSTTAPASGASGEDAPVAAIVNAVAPYGAGYEFTTTITVDGAVNTDVVGRRVGTGTTLTITSNGVTVDQVMTETGTWVRKDGTTWTPLDSASTADPLTPLKAPLSWAPTPAVGTFQATYAPEAFGLDAGDPLAVEVRLTEGRLSGLTYVTSVGGKPTVVTTAFSTLTDTTPITAPA